MSTSTQTAPLSPGLSQQGMSFSPHAALQAPPNMTASSDSGPKAVTRNGDTRLVIDQDNSTGAYIYKTVDRITGDVIKQYPREKMISLAKAPDYVSGSVISTNI